MPVYDFESDGLLAEVTRLHCGVFLNIKTRVWTGKPPARARDTAAIGINAEAPTRMR